MSEANQSSIEWRTFSKLKRLYILALSAIAISVLVSQVFIHRFLDDQENDSTLVNIAGRQRMLSQKLSKEAIRLLHTGDKVSNREIASEMRKTVSLWAGSQQTLINGNKEYGLPENDSETIRDMFHEITPYFKTMESSANYIIGHIETGETADMDAIRPAILKILENESPFLERMDRIVNQYEKEAGEKVKRLERLEITLTFFTLLVLLCEFIFIFFPTAKAVRNTISQLIASEKKARKMAYHADKLSLEKDRSVKELKVLNQAINQTLLFARIYPDGEIIQLGEKFSRIFKIRELNNFNKFQDLFSVNDTERKQIETLLHQNSRLNWQGEVKVTSSAGKNIWMEMSLIPYNPGNNQWEILIIAIDITSRKEAQLEIERLTKEQFEEKMNRQKLVSSKIIENQEQEQNRIAKDIHDGIGQMLTGLSLNLQSIDIGKPEKADQKIGDLKELVLKIIKGVRTATFNLMPPELSDHGIVPALNKLTEELSKLTGKTIFLYDKTGFDHRLDSLVEINIYRITQEAVNNAIKYAGSSQIIVSVSHSDSLLSINIDDNGKGFDPQTLKPGNGEGGMGISYMKERIRYIDGRLFINSQEGKGTRVTINIPLSAS